MDRVRPYYVQDVPVLIVRQCVLGTAVRLDIF